MVKTISADNLSKLTPREQRIHVSKEIKDFVLNNHKNYDMKYVPSYFSDEFPDLIVLKKNRVFFEPWREVLSLNSFLKK